MNTITIRVYMNTEQLIQMLKECSAIKFGHFILTSGAISDYYVNIKKAMAKIKYLTLEIALFFMTCPPY